MLNETVIGLGPGVLLDAHLDKLLDFGAARPAVGLVLREDENVIEEYFEGSELAGLEALLFAEHPHSLFVEIFDLVLGRLLDF